MIQLLDQSDTCLNKVLAYHPYALRNTPGCQAEAIKWSGQATGAGRRVQQRLPTHGAAPTKTEKAIRTTPRKDKHTLMEKETTRAAPGYQAEAIKWSGQATGAGRRVQQRLPTHGAAPTKTEKAIRTTPRKDKHTLMEKETTRAAPGCQAEAIKWSGQATGAGRRVQQRLPTHGAAPTKTEKAIRTTPRKDKHTLMEKETTRAAPGCQAEAIKWSGQATGAGRRVQQRLPTHGAAPTKTEKAIRTTPRKDKHTLMEKETTRAAPGYQAEAIKWSGQATGAGRRVQQRLPTHGAAPTKTEKAIRTTPRKDKHTLMGKEKQLERHLAAKQM